jgi:hypothetical protein
LFAALFEEKLNKLLDQLNLSRISGRIYGIRPYRISGRPIWYPAGYRISKKAGLSGRISGASLLKNLYTVPVEVFLIDVKMLRESRADFRIFFF